MAQTDRNKSFSIDPNSGFCKETKIFHSLRPRVPLPPPHLSISTADFAFSLLQKSSTSPQTTTALIDSATGLRLSYSDFLRHTHSLSSSLRTQIGLSRADTALILSPTSLQIPILYFSLLSLGVTISPANPLSTNSEIFRQIHISKPTIAFVTTSTAHKLPPTSLRYRTILLDSDEFHSMMTTTASTPAAQSLPPEAVEQSDTAAILYPSGTTGPVKGVVLTHRNYIALLSTVVATATTTAASVVTTEEEEEEEENVQLVTLPLCHTFGFVVCLMGLALGATMVLMTERFDLEGMLKAAAEYHVTSIPMVPPPVMAMAKEEIVDKYNLSSLRRVICGGAPLGNEVSERFAARFPHVLLCQVLPP